MISQFFLLTEVDIELYYGVVRYDICGYYVGRFNWLEELELVLYDGNEGLNFYFYGIRYQLSYYFFFFLVYRYQGYTYYL